MKTKIFRDAGLNQNEAETYRLLLEDGELTPPEVAERLHITRQNGYAILKSLESLGLAQIDRRHNKFSYVPGDPKILEGILTDKRKRIETTEDQLADALPELTSFYNLAKDRPGISVFKGVDGIQTLYEDTLKRKPKEILLILSEQGKGSYLANWIIRHYRPLRIKNKTALREIITTPEKHNPDDLKALLWEKKHVPLPSLPRDIDILVYDDNVTFIKYDKKQPVGFTIDDKLVYEAIRSFFEMIWVTGI